MLALSKRRKFLVAVSGGRDSVALLHGLHRLGFRNLAVIHLDHRLRGAASRADARFVARLAGTLNLPVESTRADTRGYAKSEGVSLELAARIMRHIFFEDAARRTRCRSILVAHHADDQVETCLFNFLRGSGAAGLAGMHFEKRHRHFTLFRPLLNVRRSEIDEFVARHRIEFREDATNAGLFATRNKLRHRVIPAIEDAMGTSYADAILRAAAIFAAEEEWMRGEAHVESETLSVRDLTAAPLALRRRIVRQWLHQRGIADVGFSEVERVLSLLDMERGPAKVNLPGSCHARRRQGRLFLE